MLILLKAGFQKVEIMNYELKYLNSIDIYNIFKYINFSMKGANN